MCVYVEFGLVWYGYIWYLLSLFIYIFIYFEFEFVLLGWKRVEFWFINKYNVNVF